MAYDVLVSPRALREIYLMPFMLAEKFAKPWSFMTAYAPFSYGLLILSLDFARYNKVNGTHVSENELMIKEVLRREWGSKAMTMSDWYAGSNLLR